MNLEVFEILKSINRRQELIEKAEKIITELRKIFEINNNDKAEKEISCSNRDINHYYTRITYDIKFEAEKHYISFNLHVIPDLSILNHYDKKGELVTTETTAVADFLKKPSYHVLVRENRGEDMKHLDVIEYNNEIFLTDIGLYTYKPICW